jgi:hypothetical protein
MKFDLEDAIGKIIKNPYFIKQKQVLENNPYHLNESVYDHAIKTKNIALKEVSGEFIIDDKARLLFRQFTKEDFYGVLKKDILVMTALLHDIGKIFSYKEEGETSPIISRINQTTFLSGHEYLGSLIVDKVISELDISAEVVGQIANLVRLHDTFTAHYFSEKKHWEIEQLVSDVKSQAEGYFVEVLFNRYCDCYDAGPFLESKKTIEGIFNQPALYSKREYFVA